MNRAGLLQAISPMPLRTPSRTLAVCWPQPGTGRGGPALGWSQPGEHPFFAMYAFGWTLLGDISPPGAIGATLLRVRPSGCKPARPTPADGLTGCLAGQLPTEQTAFQDHGRDRY